MNSQLNALHATSIWDEVWHQFNGATYDFKSHNASKHVDFVT